MGKKPHPKCYGIIPAGVLPSPLPKRSKGAITSIGKIFSVGCMLIILQNFLLFKSSITGECKMMKNSAAVDDEDHRNAIDFTWSSFHKPGDSKKTNQPIIAYVTQGKADSCLFLKQKFQRIFNSYVFICHSYDKECDDDDDDDDDNDGGNFLCIYQPNTTFAEGKNIIVRATVESSAWSQIKYVVSFDDDAPLFALPFKVEEYEQDVGWSNFHDMLLNPNTTHPLIKPKYYPDFNDTETTYQTCTDENFWVIRKDHLPVIYPSSTIGKEYHWINSYRVFHLLHRCYPQGMQVVHNFFTGNPNHNHNTTDYHWPKLYELTISMLQEGYPTLGPWEKNHLNPTRQRCVVGPKPSIGLHPTCKDVMVERFQNWIDGKYQP